jgi:hypothetical protein
MRTAGLQNAAVASWARRCAAPAAMAAARELCSQRRAARGTPVRLGADWSMSVETSVEMKSGPRNSGSTSRRAARCWWRRGLIREKIIGHRMRSVQPRFGPGDGVRNLPGMLSLFHQPARQHGRGVFFEPLIEQSADLLAEIGGMTQTCQFIRLQRVARSGQKKLPRRLGLVAGHGILLRGQGNEK